MLFELARNYSFICKDAASSAKAEVQSQVSQVFSLFDLNVD